MREWIVAGEDAGMRLDKWLAVRTDAGSRGRATDWIASGKIFLEGQPVEPHDRGAVVVPGQRVGVWIDRPGSSKPAARAVRDARSLLSVVHEDDAIVVADKPAGLLVEPLPGRAGEEPTLADLVADRERHAPGRHVYVVHRIDRDTSGLVLFARTLAARESLKSQFAGQTPDRTYLAVVLGQPSPAEGVWRDILAWDAAALRQRQAHGRDARGKEAVARYRVIETFAADVALVEVSLVTGKRNQIRVQAALRGHPLLGERQYRFGAPAEPPELPRIDRQALHASALGFVHPATGRPVQFTAPPPMDLTTLLRSLRTKPSTTSR